MKKIRFLLLMIVLLTNCFTGYQSQISCQSYQDPGKNVAMRTQHLLESPYSSDRIQMLAPYSDSSGRINILTNNAFSYFKSACDELGVLIIASDGYQSEEIAKLTEYNQKLYHKDNIIELYLMTFSLKQEGTYVGLNITVLRSKIQNEELIEIDTPVWQGIFLFDPKDYFANPYFFIHQSLKYYISNSNTGQVVESVWR